MNKLKLINKLMRSSVGYKQTEARSQEFYTILGVCFNDVCAVFLEVFGYIQTYINTYIQTYRNTYTHTESFIL